MSFHLYLRPHPRTLLLVSPTSALVIKPHLPAHDEPGPSKKPARNLAIVEFLPLDEVDLEGAVRISRNRGIGGVLGLLNIPIGGFHPLLLDHPRLTTTCRGNQNV